LIPRPGHVTIRTHYGSGRARSGLLMMYGKPWQTSARSSPAQPRPQV